MLFKLINLVLYCLCSTILFSQTPTFKVPIQNLPNQLDSIITVIDDKLEKDLATITVRKPYKNQIEEAYTKRAERVKFSIEDGHYFFEEEVMTYLNKILEEIFDSNPDIPRNEIRFFLSLYPWPNASSIGEGTIVLNIGLLRRLENESQLAFVLCHEIAHYTLNHSNKSIKHNVEMLHGDKTERQLKKIKKQAYKVQQSARALLKKMLYETRRHQREREAEADEWGLKYLKNTKYDATEAKRLIEILDVIDEEKYKNSTNLTSVFDAEEYPFKKKWIQEESLLRFDGDDDDMEKDSLKTHPDCAQRIKLLPAQLESYKAPPGKNIHEGQLFSDLVFMSDFGMIESYFFFEDYGKCIYYALKLLNEYPDSPYLYATIGKTFHQIHINQSEHTLGTRIDQPNKDQELEYQELLRFLHRLRLKEMAKVNYYFLEKVKDNFLDNEDFYFAWFAANDLMEYKVVAKKLRKEYFKKFPDGYYYDYLKGY